MQHHTKNAFPKAQHTGGSSEDNASTLSSPNPIHHAHGRTDALAFGNTQPPAPSALPPSGRPRLPEQPNIQPINEPINEPEDVCLKIREHLINTQGHNRVRRYLSGTVTMSQIGNDTIEIIAGDRFTLDMIERRLGDPIRIGAQFAMGTTQPKISYRVDAARHGLTQTKPGRDAQAKNSNSQSPTDPNAHPLATRIPDRHAETHNPTHRPAHQRGRFPACPTLNDFLVGSSNRLAFESVKQVLMSGIDCPPVFVHGVCGVGKTHLLRGATQYARQLRPGCKVRYTTGEAFTNGFVSAIRSRTVEVFKKKYKGLDLLCIDDIHLMAGKQATQHELLQIFNTLSLGGAKIILASDAHPREIARLDQSLASRFAAGLVVKVETPDLELARRLVAHIASKRGVFLDQPAIQTIVDRVGIGRIGHEKSASVRDLEGAIVQIQAVARLMDRSSNSSLQPNTPSRAGSIHPTLSHIRRALSLRDGSDETHRTSPIALDSIITKICQEMTVSKSDLVGKGRQKKVVMARELIVHTARSLTSKSFPEIAYAIGRPNHSTVITAAKRFKDRVSAEQTIEVGCPHDGLPAGELAEMMASRVHQK